MICFQQLQRRLVAFSKNQSVTTGRCRATDVGWASPAAEAVVDRRDEVGFRLSLSFGQPRLPIATSMSASRLCPVIAAVNNTNCKCSCHKGKFRGYTVGHDRILPLNIPLWQEHLISGKGARH